MKRKFYLMGIMLLAGLSSQAQQGWLATTPLPGNVKNTIVRHYLDEQSISYIRTGNGCYFAWSDNQNFIQLVQIDCAYEVKDFEIIEDTVCFCGTDGTYGFAGWFSIPDLMAGTDYYHIYNLFKTQYPNYVYPYTPFTSYVTVFNDLTIFDNPEDQMRRVHVALVGNNDKNFVCNTRAAATLSRAAIDRNVFAQRAAFADAHAGRFARIFQILRGCAEDSPVKHVRVLTDGNPAVNVHARFQDNVLPNLRTGIHNAPRADDGCFVNFCLRAHKCGRVYHISWQNLVGSWQIFEHNIAITMF